MSEEEKKAKKAAKDKRYRLKYPEKCKERMKKWYQANKSYAQEVNKQWAKNNPDKNREIKRQWAAKNYEKTKPHQKEYHLLNKERINKRQLEYYYKTIEKRKEYSAQYRLLNKEKINKKNSLWRKNNPAKHCAHSAKRRALKLKSSSIDNLKEITLWIESWKYKPIVSCHWCHKEIPGTLAHADHIIPLSRGGTHTLDNLAVSCISCNQRKHNKLPEDWIKILRREAA
jgi:HNH endonuclease